MIDAAIVGAGLAGLNCAAVLERAGLNVIVLEAADAPGGRVRTDVVEGFRLDRGFQVLLSAYPEAQRLLDYKRLDVKKFEPGAQVWHAGRFHHFADPSRNPLAAAKFALDGVVPFSDKMHVAKLRKRVHQGSWKEIFAAPEKTPRQYLQQVPLSEAIIQRF